MAGSGEGCRVFLLQPEHLAGDVGGAQHDRAAAFKVGAGGFGIGALDGWGERLFVVDHGGGWAVVVHQHAAGAVAAGDEGVQAVAAGEGGEVGQEPFLQGCQIVVAVGRAVMRRVGGGEGFQDLALRGDDVEFDVGFADVEDGYRQGRVVRYRSRSEFLP